jgi:hypothetical protein
VACLLLLAGALTARQTPALVNIPAPTLALNAPHPAIEASRQSLVSEDRIRTANILLETAEQRLASANRLMRAARQQVRLAEQIAQAATGAPVSRVACQQPAAAPAAPNMNKI